MTKFQRAIAFALAAMLVMLAGPIWSCGPDFTTAVFVPRRHPDLPLDKFPAGRLGIIQTTWDKSYLYVAYRVLSGPAFDSREQKALVSMWNDRLNATPSTQPDAQALYLDARSKVPGVSQMTPFDVYRAGPSYTNYVNCNTDAFRAASATLQTMVTKYGLASPQVKRWVDAQDMVFANCSATQTDPPPAAQIPEPLKDGTPLEQAQRAYQIACANFYSGNFDNAAKMFEAIGRDKSSPWNGIAPYLVARATIRRATLAGDKNDDTLLAQAETQLNNFIASPGADGMKSSAQGLLSFVTFKLRPGEREAALAQKLMTPGSAADLQDVADYTSMIGAAAPADSNALPEITDWMSDFPTGDPAHAIEKWKKTRSLPWLIAALIKSNGSTPDADALMKAGEKLGPDSPGYLTASYHLVRLMVERGATDQARARIDPLLTGKDAMPAASRNQFLMLRVRLARDPNEFLKFAQLQPVSISTESDSQEMPISYSDPDIKRLADGPLFDKGAAEILDHWVPMSFLTDAAHGQVLASNLRSQVAISAWTRAILLSDDNRAHELAPVVSELVPALKPGIEAWSAAKSPDASRFEAALMMLRNPGMSPYVDPGVGRITPIDKLDDYRDNWWCAPASMRMPKPSEGTLGGAAATQTYPSFLSDSDRKSVDAQWHRLAPIDGPKFMCTEAIAHAKKNPDDARNAEALSRCVQAVKLGCSVQSDDLAKSAFEILQRRFPKTTWATQRKVWVRGGGVEGRRSPFFGVFTPAEQTAPAAH